MFIADLHIHSRFSRATSPTCESVRLDYWARRKGLQLIASGDFTHEAYREELRDKLQPEGNGFYLLREEQRIADAGLAGEESPPRFIISGAPGDVVADGVSTGPFFAAPGDREGP